MYSIIHFNDYRKEVDIECVGYTSDFVKTKSSLFKNAIVNHTKYRCNNDNKFCILYKNLQTEYVSLTKSYPEQKLWKYRLAEIHIKPSVTLTIGKFCKTFMTQHGIKSIHDYKNVKHLTLTQEWMNENMDVISEHFLHIDDFGDDYDFEEDFENEEDKMIKSVERYSTVYTIVEMKEIVKES